jgi:uncharacterized damage-inducible protein DinB
MLHTREEVIQRMNAEFDHLDRLVKDLTDEQWLCLLARPDGKDPWTVKDTLAHITHWKADVIRKIHSLPVPPEEKGLNWTDGNRLVYERWRNVSAAEVYAWHLRVQQDALAALQSAPDKWFSGRDHRPEWPNDLDGHSAYHRAEIEQALNHSYGF